MAINIPLITTFDSKGVTRAIQSFKNLESGVDRSAFVLKNLNQVSTNAFKAIAKVGGFLAIGIGVAVKAFVSFDSAMNQSVAIMGDVSDEMKNKMAQAARQMAKETTFSATQAAESFYFLASAGLTAEESIGALPKVAKFAQAGMFDMATATTLLADSQSALGLRSSDTATNLQNLVRVSDVLVQANILANASVEQFAESLTNKAGASMKALNIPLEEGVAVLAQFAAVGVKGSEAGTLFNAVIRGLTNGVKDQPKEWKKLNIEVYNSSGAMNNLGDIVAMMEGALSGMSVEQQRTTLAGLGFEEQTLNGALALLGNSAAIKKYEEGLKSAGGVTDTVANNQLQSLSSKITLAKNAFVDLAIQLGEKFSPAIQAITEFVRTFTGIVGEQGLGAGLKFAATKALNLIEGLDGLGTVVYLVITAMIALKVAVIAYTAAQGLATIAVALFGLAWNTTGIGLVISLIALVITALVLLTIKFQGFKDFFIALWNGIVEAFQTYINIFLGVWEFLINKIIQGVNLIIRSWNRVQWGTDVKEIDEVSFAFDILGAKIDKTTAKLKTFQSGIGGMGQVWIALGKAGIGTGSQPDDGGDDGGGGGGGGVSKTVKTASEKFKELTSAMKGYRDQLITLKGAQKDYAQAPKDLVKATQAVTTAQTHFNKTLHGFGLNSKQAQTATRNLEKAQRNGQKAAMGLADAQQGVLDAQKALNDLLAPASARSIAEAQDDITKSQLGLAQANRDLEDARFKNFSTDAQVESARRIVEAQDAITEADYNQLEAYEKLREAQSTGEEKKIALAAIDVRNALSDFADASRELQDAQREASLGTLEAQEAFTEAEIQQRDAVNQLSDSQAVLSRLQNGATAEELRDANQRLTSAMMRVTEAQIEVQEATAATTLAQTLLDEAIFGAAEGTDAYREALDALIKAQADEVEATDKVTESYLALKDAKLALAEAEKKLDEQKELTSLNDFIRAARLLGLGGSRAYGGAVKSNKSYIVGERGPEIFSPHSSGMISPNSSLASGNTIGGNTIINITTGADPQAIVRALQQYNRTSGAIAVNTRAL